MGESGSRYLSAVAHIREAWPRGCQCEICGAVDRRKPVINSNTVIATAEPMPILSENRREGLGNRTVYGADVGRMTI
jgi:hypothetical protein